MSEEYRIRRAESPADYRACQRAQRSAWGIQEDGYVVPVATMVAAQMHGGLVLGAFRPDGEAVALSFAFLGRAEGRLCLYSQLTGVVPGYQDRGIGGQLKRMQFDYAREQGLERLVWSFDPLQAGNARFNLAKLGATVGRYQVDMYGPRSDALNKGTPTDRLIADWATDDRPRTRFEAAEALALPHLIDAVADHAGEVVPGVIRDPVDRSAWLLEIPDQIGRLRAEDPERAERWQMTVREAFLAAFRAGFRAVDFIRESSEGRARAYYVLARQDADAST